MKVMDSIKEGVGIHIYIRKYEYRILLISKNTSLMQLISIYFAYCKSLHVSGRTLPIIRRI